MCRRIMPPLRADYEGPDPIDGGNARWPRTSLLVESLKTKSAAFFHVLIPYATGSPLIKLNPWETRAGNSPEKMM